MTKITLYVAVVVFTFVSLSTASSLYAQGPGTEMTQIINRLGFGADCGRCQALASEMDQNGAAWVMQNRADIAKRTIGNAENLGHRMGPIRRAGVRAMIRTSVRRSQ